MNPIDIILVLIIAAILFFGFVIKHKRKKAGKGCCSGGCSGCSSTDCCHCSSR